MQVTYRKEGWSPQILQLRVEEGEVEIEKQSCIPERTCGLRAVEAEDFALDAIFAVVLEQAALHGVGHVAYNEAFGFPRIIATSEGSYEISDFRPLTE